MNRPWIVFLIALTGTALTWCPLSAAAQRDNFAGRPPADAFYRQPDLPIETRVDDLLRRMTLAEKLGQLHQSAVSYDQPGKLDTAAYKKEIADGAVGSFSFCREDPEARNQLQRMAVEQTRLGIPLMFGLDVVHGFRTIFPNTLGVSCTWDPELYERLEQVAAKESSAAGIDWIFGPMCDVARDPRWGRVSETFGEDPYLISRYITAAVNGLQGRNPAGPGRVAACLKHFAGYSAVVGGRDYNFTEISPFIMRNVFLPSFHAGVQAGALTVMSAFNANDGIPATDNAELLTNVLRGEWDFRGFVISDWGSLDESITWGYAKDKTSAARLALNAGTDVEMVSHCFDELISLIQAGKFPVSTVDEAVRRVLRVKFQLGLFENPFVDAKAYPTKVIQPDALALARQAVAEGSVLLKNDGILPLSKQRTDVALIGPFGDNAQEMYGSWPGLGHPGDVVTLAQGLRGKLAPGARLEVVNGCGILDQAPTDPEPSKSGAAAKPDDFSAAVAAARRADVVVMALGEPGLWTGEKASRSRLGLTGRQQALFDAVAAIGKPVIAVVFCGRPLVLTAIAKKAAALLIAWQPGIQAGNGLADLLFGDASPSGRLTMSFPREVGQVPVYYNHYETGRPNSTDYKDLSSSPQYQFGYGLTYTTFQYGAVRILPGENGRPAKAVATITNTGRRKGEEVVQLYIRQMACPEGARPVQELRGFRRITLNPGESTTVGFPLTSDVLGYYGRDGTWRADKGVYHVTIAPHAETGTPAVYDYETD